MRANEVEHELSDPKTLSEQERMETLGSFFFSSRRRHTRFDCDWSSDVCSSDLATRGVFRRLYWTGWRFRLSRLSAADNEVRTSKKVLRPRERDLTLRHRLSIKAKSRKAFTVCCTGFSRPGQRRDYDQGRNPILLLVLPLVVWGRIAVGLHAELRRCGQRSRQGGWKKNYSSCSEQPQTAKGCVWGVRLTP